jgi:hypothetical protein
MFAGEVHFMIASLYWDQRRNSLGEAPERDKAFAHWKSAHEHYGDAFSVFNILAMANCAGVSAGDLSLRIKYYKWIQQHQDGVSTDDVWPYPSIEQAIKGIGPKLPTHFITGHANGSREFLKDFEANAVTAVLQRHADDPVALRRIIKEVPDSQLAAEAEKALGSYRQGFLEEESAQVVSPVPVAQSYPSSPSRASAKYSVVDALVEGSIRRYVLLAVAVILVTLGLLMVMRRRRTPS